MLVLIEHFYSQQIVSSQLFSVYNVFKFALTLIFKRISTYDSGHWYWGATGPVDTTYTVRN